MKKPPTMAAETARAEMRLVMSCFPQIGLALVEVDLTDPCDPPVTGVGTRRPSGPVASGNRWPTHPAAACRPPCRRRRPGYSRLAVTAPRVRAGLEGGTD